jgi:FO synthase subunit 1
MDLVSRGANDLGGISREKDFVNPDSPWEEIAVYEKSLMTRGVALIPRLPIYKQFYKKRWFSDQVGAVISTWVKRREFQYYLQ